MSILFSFSYHGVQAGFHPELWMSLVLVSFCFLWQEWVTKEACSRQLICRGLNRACCVQLLDIILTYLTSKGFINVGLVRPPPHIDFFSPVKVSWWFKQYGFTKFDCLNRYEKCDSHCLKIIFHTYSVLIFYTLQWFCILIKVNCLHKIIKISSLPHHISPANDSCWRRQLVLPCLNYVSYIIVHWSFSGLVCFNCPTFLIVFVKMKGFDCIFSIFIK